MELEIEFIREQINTALDNAEDIWNQVETEILLESLQKGFSAEMREIPTRIPGFPKITEGSPEVAKFIALVLDIRNSTDHLTHAISKKISDASQLERVLYEITAVNTAGSIVVDHYNGSITEFLGDGFLALFKVNNQKDPKEVYHAHNSAKFLIKEALNEINTILNYRYRLPALQIGIGMAFSQAIITVVGFGENIHPKALGECVYRASKLSDGINQVRVDDRLKLLWPKTKGGTLKFHLFSNSKIDFKAFEISRS